MINKEQLSSLVLHCTELLSHYGFRPKQVEEYRLQFYVEGMSHILQFHETDPAFAYVMVPAFCKLDTPDLLQCSLLTANEASRSLKGAKTYVRDEDDGGHAISVNVEFLVVAVEAVTIELIARQIKMAKAAMDHFEERFEVIRSECEHDCVRH